jgi:hypothetical protein
MELRSCRVTLSDLAGVEHTVEVTAATLYEAVALGIKAITSDPWTEEIAHGLNTVRVLAKAPQIEHIVQIQKFQRWLAERGTTPGEMTARAKIREILGVKAS